MVSDSELRQKIKILKAIGKIKNYYDIAEMIDINANSLYNYLQGYYRLSNQKKRLLNDILNSYNV